MSYENQVTALQILTRLTRHSHTDNNSCHSAIQTSLLRKKRRNTSRQNKIPTYFDKAGTELCEAQNHILLHNVWFGWEFFSVLSWGTRAQYLTLCVCVWRVVCVCGVPWMDAILWWLREDTNTDTDTDTDPVTDTDTDTDANT